MSKSEKKAYLRAIIDRYKQVGKAAKATILDEFCIVCHYARKYAIRLLNGPLDKPRKKAGRTAIYTGKNLLNALKCIWLTSDQMCSKKLKAALPIWLPFYEEDHEPLSGKDRHLLLSMSPATMDRILKPAREKFQRKRFCCTRPGTLLKHQIPIKTSHWDVSQPGFMEADTVAHCGNTTEGDYIYSITMTDILTGWTESRATWNKGAEGVKTQIQDIEGSLPFPLRGFDCDNGSEFLNYHLYSYFRERKKPVEFTRSRPNRKNDNAYVEQKNWTYVRYMLGYERLEDPVLVDVINDLYANEWALFQNHFCPTLKLKEKVKINSKYRKRYEAPKTPYQRIMDSEHIQKDIKRRLEDLHFTLNPFRLKKVINAKLKTIFTSVRLSSNVRTTI